MKVRIKDIETQDRPRERLINNGVESLSNEEKMQISKSLKITLSKKREKESIENGELWFDFS